MMVLGDYANFQQLSHYQARQWGALGNPLQIIQQPPPDRIQAVLTAGAVKSACERLISEREKAQKDTEADLIAKISPLLETSHEVITYEGWGIFKRRIKTTTKHIPTESEQAAHRGDAEKRAAETASYLHGVPDTVRTLSALAAHFPPTHPMPLEGEYLKAIAKYLEPFPCTTPPTRRKANDHP